MENKKNTLLEGRALKKFYGDKVAVNSVDIELNSSSVLGLLGENGAGKSTLISMLISKLKPDSGEILYKGKKLADAIKDYRKILAYVPQELGLFDELSGRDNLTFWARAYGLSKGRLLEKVDYLSDLFCIGENLDKPVKHYSGGFQRRLNIACALLHEPEILFLDEPTVGIDARARRDIINIVKDLSKEGIAVLYTSHYIDEIERVADSIMILKDGSCVLEKTKEDLKNIGDLETFYLGNA